MRRKPTDFDWTDERIAELRRLYAEGMTLSKIAKVLGCSKGSAIGKSHRLKLPSRPSPIGRPAPGSPAPKHQKTAWSDDDIARVKAMVKDGASSAGVAKAMNIPWDAARQRMRRAGVRTVRQPQVKRVTLPRRVSVVSVARVVPQVTALLPVERPALVSAPVVRVERPPIAYAGRVSECTFITSEGRPWLFCEKPTLPGKSMCEQHWLTCFRVAEPGRRAA